MNRAVLGATVLLLVSGCTSSAGSAAKPSPNAVAIVGGCAGTVLTAAEPPAWAQGGWSQVKGTPWPPWAIATTGDAVAFVFARELVAGSSPRSDGTQNKILWVEKNPTAFTVEGRPLGKAEPVVTVPGGPSIVDVPSAGCWTFHLLQAERTSVINLEVLPEGTVPG